MILNVAIFDCQEYSLEGILTSYLKLSIDTSTVLARDLTMLGIDIA